jgi:hypothetical protein
VGAVAAIVVASSSSSSTTSINANINSPGTTQFNGETVPAIADASTASAGSSGRGGTNP